MLQRDSTYLAIALMALPVVAQAQRQFTDILTPGVTVIRARHLTEVRAAVNAAREDCDLAAAAWTDQQVVPGITPVKATHVMELRTALAEAFRACGGTPPKYTDDPLRAGTPIKAVHLTELREALIVGPVGGVAQFLEAKPRIAAAMLWLDTDNRLTPYAEWPQALQQKLALSVGQMMTTATRLPEVMANQADTSWRTVLSREDAEDLYVANVAYSLILEMLGTLPWSLDDLTDHELRLLLGSQGFYAHYGSVEGAVGYIVNHSFNAVVPAPPEVVREFIAAEGLVGDSRYETVINTIDWARYQLIHFSYPAGGGNDYEADVDHWDYRGGSPLARVLEGTTRKRDGTTGHFTAGCGGTNSFFIHVLRAVNIPVEYIIWEGHAVPSFPSEALYLSHGDDPYNGLAKPLPPFPEPFPASEIPIDEATYQEWFNESNSKEENLNNVGRRTTELAVKHLSPYLLRARCDDLAHGRSNEESEVYRPGNAGVGRYWTVAELEAMRFWERMDAKIAQYGGCSVFGY